ncbi:MAG: hypothetical protein V8R46_04355 [Eubacterium ramulus]
MMGGTVALSIILAVAIFMILPYYLWLCSRFIASDMVVAVIEGNPSSCNFYRIYIADLKDERDSACVHVSWCGA